MNPDSQRRLHVRRALLNKKNGANTQSFLCPLIQLRASPSCINGDYQIFFVMSSVCIGY
jgi:hypothetical protein